MTAERMAKFVERLDWFIMSGRSDADLIPWNGLEDHDSARETADARAALESVGWVWNPILEQLERGGWYAWFRPQGHGAPPIVQWNRLNVPLPDAVARRQLTLF
jgi:hypothetical protein